MIVDEIADIRSKTLGESLAARLGLGAANSESEIVAARHGRGLAIPRYRDG